MNKPFLLIVGVVLLFLSVAGQSLTVSPSVVGVGGIVELTASGLNVTNYSQTLDYCSLSFLNQQNSQIVDVVQYNNNSNPQNLLFLTPNSTFFNNTANASTLTYFYTISDAFTTLNNYTVTLNCLNNLPVNASFYVDTGSPPILPFNILNYWQSNSLTLGVWIVVILILIFLASMSLNFLFK